ncbi:hypothetical protein [Demequina pelophila]|uniref:hypothetical protein n=1 Tax=Demequina pelophila TaxID=1638984 RepID=UPI001D0E0701|nr:hypothetical protein [Demequina pelophila]
MLVESEPIDLPTALVDWDYHFDLKLRRTVELQPARIRRESGLPADAPLDLAVVWNASGSNLSGTGTRHKLGSGESEACDLQLELAGADLGGVLTLTTTIVLASRLDDSPPAAPRRAGSVLWMDEVALRLQGDSAQFPMAVIDFGHTNLPPDAGWHLQITGGLESAAMGALLLLINESHEAVVGSFESAARPKPAQRAILSAVRADVARTLIEYSLECEDFEVAADYPEGSLGSACSDVFEKVFDGRSVADVRLLREHSPGLFSSELQARTSLFREI